MSRGAMLIPPSPWSAFSDGAGHYKSGLLSVNHIAHCQLSELANKRECGGGGRVHLTQIKKSGGDPELHLLRDGHIPHILFAALSSSGDFRSEPEMWIWQEPLHLLQGLELLGKPLAPPPRLSRPCAEHSMFAGAGALWLFLCKQSQPTRGCPWPAG